jgi:hypothetical protein
MWQTINKAFDEFWYPTAELRAEREAVKTKPLWTRIRFGAGWTRAHWHWPVLWRRYAVLLPCLVLAGVLQARLTEYGMAHQRAQQAALWDKLVPEQVRIEYDEHTTKWTVQCNPGDPLKWMSDFDRAMTVAKACQ